MRKQERQKLGLSKNRHNEFNIMKKMSTNWNESETVWSPQQVPSQALLTDPNTLSVPQALTSTRRPRLTSRPNLRIWTRRRTPRKSTPTSPAQPTPRTCSSCSMPSLMSSSRTTWRTVASSENKSEEESRWVYSESDSALTKWSP